MELVVLGQYGVVLVLTWCYWVSIGQYGLIYDVYWISKNRNCLILIIVSRRQFWLVFGGAGSIWGGTGWYLVILGQYNLVLLGFK